MEHKRLKLAVQFLGFYKTQAGDERALYKVVKGQKSALETYKSSEGKFFGLSDDGYPLHRAFNFFGDVGIISSYVSKKDGSIKWGPDLSDLKKLRSLSELLGTDFVSQILGREFGMPDVDPETGDGEGDED